MNGNDLVLDQMTHFVDISRFRFLDKKEKKRLKRMAKLLVGFIIHLGSERFGHLFVFVKFKVKQSPQKSSESDSLNNRKNAFSNEQSFNKSIRC